jgi:CPA1 family monovalent cation:H+ antiporter
MAGPIAGATLVAAVHRTTTAGDDVLDIVAILVVLTAAFSYVNFRFLKFPMTIGVMTIALALSLVVIVLDKLGFGLPRGREHALMTSIDFTDVLMQGMLSFLLFAGALHVDLSRLRQKGWQIAVLAVLGTALSTLLIGYGSWYLLGALGIGISLVHCLLFGALISPTDPIAVLGVLKSAKVLPNVEATIAGESLVNDGIGVVLFTLLLGMLESGVVPSAATALEVFAREALGGAAFGIALGYCVCRVLRTIDNPQVEVLITLATVLGGYALAYDLHVSGPLAMVASGLLIGSEGRSWAMSEQTRLHLDIFWQLLDELLNGVLFLLIGLEFALIAFPAGSILAVPLVIVLAVLARYLVVGLPATAWRRWFRLPSGSGLLLTWGGVRGGISVALALSLPPGEERDIVLMLTYAVVVFSILAQGLTVGRVARALRLGADQGRG